MTYQIIQEGDRFYAVLDKGGVRIGPYDTEELARRDMDSITEHLERRSFAGAR